MKACCWLAVVDAIVVDDADCGVVGGVDSVAAFFVAYL